MNTAIALQLPASPVQPEPGANDDPHLRPEQFARLEVLRAPIWPGTAPVAVVVVRDGAGRLVEQLDGADGVRVLGEALELCAERGLAVREIVEGAASAPASARVAARQQRLAAEAWRAWA